MTYKSRNECVYYIRICAHILICEDKTEGNLWFVKSGDKKKDLQEEYLISTFPKALL